MGDPALPLTSDLFLFCLLRDDFTVVFEDFSRKHPTRIDKVVGSIFSAFLLDVSNVYVG
jgi:hypothetical protein